MENHEESNKVYGCLFCTTGKELAVVQRIQAVDNTVRAVAAQQEKYRTVHGEKSRVSEIFLPGYVFLEADSTMESLSWLPRTDIVRILSYGSGQWQLSGQDEAFAKWLFRYDGLLGFSKAYREGARVRIASGPLKDMEGSIIKVDKRGRSGQVELHVNNKLVRIWLGFEWIDPVGSEIERNIKEI